jgi:hypothetical protein
MSKRKQKVASTAPPQPKLREFPNWSFEQVMEVARMLYALEPFKRNSEGAYFHWNGLIEEAFDFLDKLHKFYEELAGERSRWDAENQRREKEARIAVKRKTGVPRSLVLHLREMFKNSRKEIIAEQNRAKGKKKRKKRGHRPDPKLETVIREVARDKIARQIECEETTAKNSIRVESRDAVGILLHHPTASHARVDPSNEKAPRLNAGV